MAEEVFELKASYSIDTDEVNSAIDDINQRIEEVIGSMQDLGDAEDLLFVTAAERAEAFNDILTATDDIEFENVSGGLESIGDLSEEAGSSFEEFSEQIDQALEEASSSIEGVGTSMESLEDSIQEGADSAVLSIEEIPLAFDQVVDSAEEAANSAGNSMDEMSDSADGLFETLATGATMLATLVAATAFIDSAEQQIAAELKLEQALIRNDNLRGTGIESLKSWSSEIQNATGIGDELTLFLTGNLAPLADNEQNLKALSQATLDYAFSLTKTGLIPTQRELIKAQEQIKAALNGSSSALEMQGIAFTDLESKILLAGSETEKIELVTSKLTETYGGLGAEIFNASEELGTFKALTGRIGDFFEQIGSIILIGFAPVLELLDKGVIILSGWVEKLLSLDGVMGQIVISLTALLIALGPTLLVTKLMSGAMRNFGINTLFSKFSLDAFTISLNLSTLGIAAIIALIVVALLRSDRFKEVLGRLMDVFMRLADTLFTAVLPIFDALIRIIEPLLDIVIVLVDVALLPLLVILEVLLTALEPLISLFGILLQFVLLPLLLPLELIAFLIGLLAEGFLFLADKAVNLVVIPSLNMLLEMVNFLIKGFNLLITVINKIPGVDIEPIREFAPIEPLVIIKPENVEMPTDRAFRSALPIEMSISPEFGEDVEVEIDPVVDQKKLSQSIKGGIKLDPQFILDDFEDAVLPTVEGEVELVDIDRTVTPIIGSPGGLRNVERILERILKSVDKGFGIVSKIEPKRLEEAKLTSESNNKFIPLEKEEKVVEVVVVEKTVDNSVTISNPGELDTVDTLNKARGIQRQNALFKFSEAT